jgi:hypothetical protein
MKLSIVIFPPKTCALAYDYQTDFSDIFFGDSWMPTEKQLEDHGLGDALFAIKLRHGGMHQVNGCMYVCLSVCLYVCVYPSFSLLLGDALFAIKL